MLALLLACATPPAAPSELLFLRDAVLAPAPAEGRALADGRVLVERPWQAGERVELGGAQGLAPVVADCVPLFRVGLGDVSRHMARGGEAPDTALAFSPDGAKLAVGTFRGELLVLDAWTGAVQARRQLSEALVKQVAWSPDGAVIYAAEQSAEALVYALAPADLSTRWSVRLADHVGTSAPPAGEDLYGVYTLPFASGLLPDADGVLVSAVHGWNDPEGARRNASRILRLGLDGVLVAAWPAEGAADASFKIPRQGGRLLAVPIGRSAAGPPPPGLPVDGVQLLDARTLEPRGARVADPLLPWYAQVFLWESVDVDARALLMGHADGRVQLWPLAGGEPLQVDLGTPVMAGEVPISASVGHARLVEGEAIVLTSGTNIPYGAAAAELRPPGAHPNENAVWVYGPDGGLRWTWRGPQVVQGFTVAGDLLVVGAGDRRSDRRTDLFGALVFDRSGQGSGAERLRAFCATEGPVFFRQAVTSDGRVAVAEHPFLQEDGGLAGAYRVTVLR